MSEEKKTPLVTVLMPVFNGAFFVSEAIKALLSLDYSTVAQAVAVLFLELMILPLVATLLLLVRASTTPLITLSKSEQMIPTNFRFQTMA